MEKEVKVEDCHSCGEVLMGKEPCIKPYKKGCCFKPTCCVDDEWGVTIAERRGVASLKIDLCKQPCCDGFIELFPVYAGIEITKLWTKVLRPAMLDGKPVEGAVVAIGDSSDDEHYIDAVSMDTGLGSLHVSCCDSTLYAEDDMIKIKCLQDVDSGCIEISVESFSYN